MKRLEIGGKIELAFTPAPAEPLRKLISEWVRSSARAVTVITDSSLSPHVLVRVKFFRREHNGYHVLRWRNAEMSYGAVSDLNTDEMRRFVQLLRER